jgi:hypothetical protein
MFMFGELEKKNEKEAIVAYFKVLLSRNLSKRLRKTTKNFSQGS